MCWDYKFVSPLYIVLEEWICELRILCNTKLAIGALKPREGKGFFPGYSVNQWDIDPKVQLLLHIPHCPLLIPFLVMVLRGIPYYSKACIAYLRVQPLQYETQPEVVWCVCFQLGKTAFLSPLLKCVFRVAHLYSTLNHNVFLGYQPYSPIQDKAAQGTPWQALNLSWVLLRIFRSPTILHAAASLWRLSG